MKGKIICILIMMLLITITIPAVGTINNNDGLKNSNQEIATIKQYMLRQKSSLRSYNIAVINAGQSPDLVELQLESWGLTVDLINIDDITVDLLSGYCVVWVPQEASQWIDNSFKDDEIRDYVFIGGGLIFCQPNPVSGPYTPKCLPYTWEILSKEYTDPCAATIVDPTHDLTVGLTLDDMPDCYDTMGTIAPEYTILALSAEGEPGFACATYGSGRIIVQMDYDIVQTTDVCGDTPPISQDMVMRMLEWVCIGRICCNPSVLDFQEVPPETTVTEQINVCNCNNPGSLLDWYVDTTNLPPWGTWVFNPSSGVDLPGGDCEVVNVTLTAPVGQGNYSGIIYIRNQNYPSNYCHIYVFVTVKRTRVLQNPLFLMFLERFPTIQMLLQRLGL